MNATKKMNPVQQAEMFLARCAELGWRVTSVDDSVITIAKHFLPGSLQQLVACDMEYGDLLSLCPHRGGSTWGTDCGGIGGMSALTSGVFRMHKSGDGAKRFSAAVFKALNQR